MCEIQWQFGSLDYLIIPASKVGCVCVIYQLLNWGRAQARKRKSSPMEPLKAKATNAEKECLSSESVLWWSICHSPSFDKEMLTCYLWLPPSWIEIILVTAVQLMPTANQRPSFFLWSTFQPISWQHEKPVLSSGSVILLANEKSPQ